MSKMTSSLLAAGLSAAMALTAFTPSIAAPMFVPNAPEANSDVVNVQDYIIRKGGWRGDGWRGDGWRRGAWNGNGWHRDGWRGDRWRHGRYRDRNLGGALVGGLITGAIVGSVINNNSQRVYRGGDAHVQWCYDRYRTYRAYDNTYVPRRGVRAQCYSPYD